MLPIRVDCRHYTGASPCRFHKQDGRSCAACGDCDPIVTRLLVVKLAAVGDVLRTTSLLPAWRRAWPSAHVTWVTDPGAAAVLAGHPFIDRILTAETCLPALLTESFDAVYGLDADARSAGLATLARAPRRLGFICDGAGRLVPANDAAATWWLMGLDDARKRDNRRTYQALMYELCELTGPVERPLFVVPDASRIRAAEWMQRQGVACYGGVVGLNTGGGRRWAQKKWTPDAYEAFIALMRQRHPELAVVLLGGPDEAALNARLIARAGDGIFDAGCDRAFADFAALVAATDVLVTSDSLGLHTATAVGVPAVVFAGPTSPWELELYGSGAVVHADVPCLGCYRSACDKPVTCMELLEPQRVVEAVDRVRGAAPASAGTTAPVEVEQVHVAPRLAPAADARA
jgi:heptosyltransferase-2